MQYILYALLAWFLYKLIFGFIIPVYRASRQMRKQFREVQERMQQQFQQQQQQQASAQSRQQSSSAAKAPAGDYIDFEEIKE
ncbi:MAG: hypothetical protein NVV59_18310 [Chitinophagaceae bacterium]|nr:hypothetical protein [Chitinophagaceae bacterium]